MPVITRQRASNLRRTLFASSDDGLREHTQPPMSESKWQELCTERTFHGNPAISPAAFRHGPPPDPRDSDSYEDRWMKLVWMELYSGLETFKKDQARKTDPFERRATLTVRVGRFDDRSSEYQVLIAGNSADNNYALPQDVSGADLVNALLRLRPGKGWVYLKRVHDMGGTHHVRADAQIYDDNFRSEDDFISDDLMLYDDAVSSDEDSELSMAAYGSMQPCIMFDSFSGCLARFHALHRYPSVHYSVREAIEASNAPRPGQQLESWLQEFPDERKTKLNEIQLSIMKRVQEPVDFVQGPPGTGKSTFIVELLETRVPHGSKVLLCTTTNKAIDSLAEKIYNCGHRNILAFGNDSRLGETSRQLTLPNRVAAHASVRKAEDLKSTAASATQVWNTIHQAAKDECVRRGDKEYYPKAMRRLIKEKATVLERTISSALQKLQQFRTLKHPRSVATLVENLVAAKPALNNDIALTESNYEETSLSKRIAEKLLNFKYVVLDEAGAMLEPDMVGTIIHGCRFLLCVGDHKQLPPFTTWRQAGEKNYRTSLLERLAKRRGCAPDHNMMTMQYRMHPKVAAIVSSTFYDESLKTPSTVSRMRAREDPVLFVDVKGHEEKQGFSFKNTQEVAAVLRIVQKERREHPSQPVNVIAFHKPQMFAIRKELDSRGTAIGFLADAQRLNVALSRAREMLYIVGDHDTLERYGSMEWKLLLAHRHLKLATL